MKLSKADKEALEYGKDAMFFSIIMAIGAFVMIAWRMYAY